MTLKERIEQLIETHGGLRAAADAIGIDMGYLSRLRHGHKDNPQSDTLERLGLRRVVTYELVKSKR